MNIVQLLKLAVLIVACALDGGSIFAQTNGEVGVPWPATDEFGLKLPMSETVGLPRPGHFVGVFYFLWHSPHSGIGPFDISKILDSDPTAITNASSPLWGPLRAPHHWGESIFGYYISKDESVLRKHAQMLSDAGVDVIIFDASNQLTYPESWQALCLVFEQIRSEGGRTPQIAFLCPFWEPRNVVKNLWNQLYGKGLYPDLWFRWKGKPLILADPARLAPVVSFGQRKLPVSLKPSHSLGQSFIMKNAFSAVGGQLPTWGSKTSSVTLTLFREDPKRERLLSCRFDNVGDSSWVSLESTEPFAPGHYYIEASLPRGPIGWWSSSGNSVPGVQAFADGQPAPGERVLRMTLVDRKDDDILRAFTFRKPQPDYFVGPTGANQWGWLEATPQHVFTNDADGREQMTVGVAQNAVDGKLSVLSNPRSYGRSYHNGAEPGPEERDFSGRNFDEQWRRALVVDPEFVFITGWNEWIAGRFDIHAPFYGPGPVTFVDEFNEEFSRDIEPMKGGHGDAYYYQMIANIRRYKGVPALPLVSPSPIIVDGRFDDWKAVEPEFRDTPGDPVKRNSPGWGKGSRYVNKTGRNDIVAAKVSMDAKNLYFYVRAREPLTPSSDPSWMLLFIDSDLNANTGWLGYDFVVNRIGVHTGTTTVERNAGGYRWTTVLDIPLRFAKNELELAIPRAALGLTNLPVILDFKWADNIRQNGNSSDFTLNGDAAPNDLYNYRAIIHATAPQRR